MSETPEILVNICEDSTEKDESVESVESESVKSVDAESDITQKKSHSRNVKKDFICTVCNRCFKKKSSLDKHYSRKTPCAVIYDDKDLLKDTIKLFTQELNIFYKNEKNVRMKKCLEMILHKRFLSITTMYLTQPDEIIYDPEIFNLYFNGVVHSYHNVFKDKSTTADFHRHF